jgi:hypothetical protein
MSFNAAGTNWYRRKPRSEILLTWTANFNNLRRYSDEECQPSIVEHSRLRFSSENLASNGFGGATNP